MPLFDYYCETCKVKEERLSKPETVQSCKTCGSEMKRFLSTPSFILKGDGFYSRGSFPNSLKEGPYIPDDIKNMSDEQLDKDLGLT